MQWSRRKKVCSRYLFEYGTCWHNSFHDLIEVSETDLKSSIQASFGAASSSDMALSRSPNLSIDAAKILVSVGQGINLRDHVRKLDLSLNPPFTPKFVMQNDGAPEDVVKFDEGLKLTVIGPREPELIALRKQHKTSGGQSQESNEPRVGARCLQRQISAELVEHRRARRAERQDDAAHGRCSR